MQENTTRVETNIQFLSGKYLREQERGGFSRNKRRRSPGYHRSEGAGREY
jgi:hypothetical protein